MRAVLEKFWRGDFGLARSFWEFAILYGTLANLAATLASFAALAGGLPPLLAVVLFFLPAPYNLLTVVAVWRSAAAYRGPPHWALLARVTVLVWVLAVTLA
jgi:hypothetical protein